MNTDKLNLMTLLFAWCLSASNAYSTGCGDLFSGSERFPLEKAVSMYTFPKIQKHLVGRQVVGQYQDFRDNVVYDSEVNGLIVDFQPMTTVGVKDYYSIKIAADGTEIPRQYLFSLNGYPQFVEFRLEEPKAELDLNNLPVATEVKDREAFDISMWLDTVLNTEDTVHGTINSLSQLVGHKISTIYQKRTADLERFKVDGYTGEVVGFERTEYSEYGVFNMLVKTRGGELVSLSFGNKQLSTFLHITISEL